MRDVARGISAVVAAACIAFAAMLAFDWVDYGLDSTCGSLIQRKSDAGPCPDIMRDRLGGVVALVAIAVVLAGFALWHRRAATSN